MQLLDDLGPTLILKGYNPTQEILATAAGLIQRFSRYRAGPARKIKFWPLRDKGNINEVEAKLLNDAVIAEMQI